MAERNEKGQFTSGNGGGPGRPARATEEKFLGALVGSVTMKDWKDIVTVHIKRAKRGDPFSTKWLSDYLMGPAIQRLQHEGTDGGPLRAIMEVVIGGTQAPGQQASGTVLDEHST